MNPPVISKFPWQRASDGEGISIILPWHHDEGFQLQCWPDIFLLHQVALLSQFAIVPLLLCLALQHQCPIVNSLFQWCHERVSQQIWISDCDANKPMQIKHGLQLPIDQLIQKHILPHCPTPVVNNSWCHHDMEMLSTLLVLDEGIPYTGGFPAVAKDR